MPTGSQGKIKYGILDGNSVAIKSCKYDNTCLNIEAKVMQQIYNDCPEVSNFFPKFLKFTKSGKLVMTRVNGIDLSDFVYDLRLTHSPKKISKLILNLCFIVLCVLETVRRKTGIVHNDLHTSNVMIINTDLPYISFSFSEKIYKYNTYGYYPIIIDFGYAYGNFDLLGSLQNSDLGYTLEEQDCLADARLLLYSSMKHFTKNTINIIKTIFKQLHLTKDGWFPRGIYNNAYDEICTIANKKSNKIMDGTLTIIINLMGNLHDDSCITTCCDNCYYVVEEPEMYILNTSDTDDFNSTESITTCTCTDKITNVFTRLYDMHFINGILASKPVLDDSILSEAAIVFKPIIVKTLLHNRLIKQKMYDKLNVKTSLDVIEEYYKLLK